MAANTAPIFPKAPNLAGFTKLTAANTATDGTGTAPAIFTAGADGARVDSVVATAGGTNVPTVLRLFINNGSSSGTAGNNALLKEVQLPATSANNDKPNGPDIEIPLNLSLPAGYKILAVIGTAVSGGWHLIAKGGDY